MHVTNSSGGRSASIALALVLCLLAVLTSLAGFATHQAGERAEQETALDEELERARHNFPIAVLRVHEYVGTRTPRARVAFYEAAGEVTKGLQGVRDSGEPEFNAAGVEMLRLHEEFIAAAERAFAAADAGETPENEIQAQFAMDPVRKQLQSSLDFWMQAQDAQLAATLEELGRITLVLWLGSPTMILGGLVILHRIWARIQVQQRELAHREGQLAEAQHLARLGSWERDLTTQAVTWSSELWRIFGQAPHAFTPTYDAFLAIVHPEDVGRIRSLVETALQTGAPFDTQLRIIRPSGEVRVIQTHGTLAYDAAGRPVRLLGTVQDITERHQMEVALQERERSLRALVGSLDDIVFEFDGDGTYVNVWTSDESLLAAPRDALLGRRVTDVLGDEIGGPYVEIFRRVLRTGRSELLEYSLDVEAGPRWFLASITPVRLGDGDFRTVSMLCRNITERKMAEAERERLLASERAALAALRSTQQQVIQQERLRALGQMASGIAHDFNNALAPIMAYSELLLAQPERLVERDRVISFLDMIRTCAQDAAGIVRRMRELYRARSDEEELVPVHLENLIAQVISLTQFRWKVEAQAAGANITITTDIRPIPPIAGVQADLREALTNLILNAVDAMPDGGTIRVDARRDGDVGIVEVRDTGIGMTDEVRLRCLEPFFTTKGEHGTGLGLGMVYGIVQRHQGMLEIESAPRQGTTVRMRLPLWSDDLRTGSTAELRRASSALRILVVEDEPPIRRALVEYLTIDGHSVETAPDGRAGLEAFRAGRFDLVLTDRALPEVAGDRVAVAIKQLNPQVPIIMVTGFGDLMNHCHELPPAVDLVVSKPVTIAGLRDAIAQVIA